MRRAGYIPASITGIPRCFLISAQAYVCPCRVVLLSLWPFVLQIASEGLKGRVFESNLADLSANEEDAFRKIRLRVEDVQGRNVLTNFWVRMGSTL